MVPDVGYHWNDHVGKVGAFFASVPLSIMAASYCFLYAYVCKYSWDKPISILTKNIAYDMITRYFHLFAGSAGLNHLQFCNLNSFRTLFILGFSCFTAISLPQYFRDYQLTLNSSPLHTRARWVCMNFSAHVWTSLIIWYSYSNSDFLSCFSVFWIMVYEIKFGSLMAR